MSDRIFQSHQAQSRIEACYEAFLARITAPVNHREVETCFGKSHVLLAGDSTKLPLVCLHGALASSAHVVSELGTLIENFQIIAPDVPGQSVRGPQIRPSLRDNSYANWLTDVLDGLGISRCDLYGASWGGFVALRTAIYAPQRVKNLVLLVPAGVVSGPIWAGVTQAAIPMALYRATRKPKYLDRFLQSQFTTDDKLWAAYMGDALRDYVLDMRPPPLVKAEELANFSVPTLVLGAEQDISFPGRKLLARVQEILPAAQMELLENCRHVPPFTDEFRNAMAKKILTFVA